MLAGPIGRSALSLVVLFGAATVLSLHTLDRLKYAFIGGQASRNWMALVGPLDVALLVVLAGAGLVALWMEWRIGAVRRLLSGERPFWLVVVTAAALVWLSHAILGRGLLVTGDAGAHVARISHLFQSLRLGESVYWDNWFFGGSTLLQFTGPVFHWLAAGLAFLTGDATEGTKLAAFASRLAAGGFMYALARQFGANHPVAALTALVYAGGFFMSYMTSVRSSFPQLVNFAAMPAILLAIERILANPPRLMPPVIGLALATIVFIGNHPPTVMLFAVAIAIHVAVRLWMTGLHARVLIALAVAGALTVLGSAFFLIPFALERGATADNFSVGSMLSIGPPSAATLTNISIWGRAGTGAEYSTYFGLPLLVFALAGGVVAVLQGGERRWLWLLALGLAVQALFVQFLYVRHVTFPFFWLSVAASVGLMAAWTHLPRLRAWIAAVFAVVLLDLSPLAIQPWTRADMLPLLAAGQSLADRAEGQRILEVSRRDGRPFVSATPNASPLLYARIGTLAGPHKQDATPTHNGFMALLKRAESDLAATGTLDPVTRDMLALLNVGWIVGLSDGRFGLPPEVSAPVTDPVLGRHARIETATPFVVAPRLEAFPRPAGFDVGPFWDESFTPPTDAAANALAAIPAIHARMRPDLAQRQAEAILVPAPPAGPAWDKAPTMRLLAYDVAAARVRLAIESSGPGYIRLAHPRALGTKVTVNGQAVAPIADVMSLIVLPLAAGTAEIVVTVAPSTLRVLCFWLTVVTVGALAITGIGGLVTGRRSALPQAPRT